MSQFDIAVDQVVARVILIEEVAVAIEDNQRLAGSVLDRHCREFCLAPDVSALIAGTVHFIDGVFRVHFAVAVSCAAVAGKILVVAEKSTTKRKPSRLPFGGWQRADERN